MAANETGKKKPDVWGCPNPKGKYGLWGLVAELESDKGFAAFFTDLLKRANANEKGAKNKDGEGAFAQQGQGVQAKHVAGCDRLAGRFSRRVRQQKAIEAH